MMFVETAITKLQLERLKKRYTEAKDAYYNSSSGKSKLTDAEFDKLEDQIRSEEPKWVGFKAGTKVKNIKAKVKLPIPIFSLDKHKAPTVTRWLSSVTVNVNVMVSDKLDGAAIEVVYEDGRPSAAYTRGNGKVGGDISYLLPHFKIPVKINKRGRVIIRCEGLFSAAKFAKYKAEFDIPRSAASGIMNRQDIHPSVKDLSVMVLQILEPNLQPSKGLLWAKSQGFTTVPFKLFKADKLNGSNLDTLLSLRKGASRYDLDGLVLTEDKINRQPTSGNPDWSIAFKTNVSTDDAPVTTVTEIEWNVSSHGVIQPTVVYKGVMWDGSTLTRANGKNAKFINEQGLGPGAKIAVVKAGEIIPDIVKVIKSVKPSVPDPKIFGAYSLEGVNYVLDNPTANISFRVQKLARFLDVIGVEFLKENTLTKMYSAGITSVRKLAAATPDDFMRVPGIKETGANKLHKALHKVLDAGIPLALLMEASGVFARGIGSRRLEAIEEQYPLLKLAAMPRAKQITLISEIHGFKEKTAEMFADGAPKFLQWMELTGIKPMSAAAERKRKAADAPVVTSNKLNGLNVSWTTYRDKEQEALVRSYGGNVIAFGSKTQVLLYSRSGKASTKLERAKEKGIEVVTWDQFAATYRIR